MIHLSRLAEDWILYSSEEFGWMELGDGVTSGSSLMPQKKNPDSLELIRGKSGRVMGALTSLMVTMKGLPMTYNRDMQEDKDPLFEAADQVSGSLEMARAVIEVGEACGAQDPAARRRRKLGGGDGSGRSAGARGHAVPPGASDRGAVRARERAQRQEARRLDARSRCAQFAPEFTGDLAALLDPRKGMKTREIAGGTGPERGRGAAARNSGWLK